jgi:hypothetical protein
MLLAGKGKDTMKTSESIAVATVSLFEEVGLPFPANPFRARQIFVSVRSKRLKLAMASLYTLFTNIHQKFGLRRMGIINGS